MTSSNCSASLQTLLADLKMLQTRLELRNRCPVLIPQLEADSALLGQLGALKPILAELRDEIVQMLTHHCPVCERDMSDAEDRERLLYVNPFCSRGGDWKRGEPRCPYRETENG